MNRLEPQYPDMLTPTPTWNITDATKLNCYMECPRKYFYNYVLGWNPEKENIHLIWGHAIHEALDCILRAKRAGKSIDDPALIHEAYNVFLTHYEKHFDSRFDDENSPKDAAGALMLLTSYCQFYRNDPIKILHVEIPGAVPVSDNHVLHFRVDTIIETEHGICSLEHKTTKMNSKAWADQWQLSLQTGCYNHVLHALWPEDDVYAIIINGLIIRKNDCDFRRIPVRRTGDMMSAWLYNVQRLLAEMDRDFEELSLSKAEDNVMTSFPMNTQSCTKWGTCQYHSYCMSWANPLQRCASAPIGMEVRHWDPSARESPPEKVFTGTRLEDPKPEEVTVND